MERNDIDSVAFFSQCYSTIFVCLDIIVFCKNACVNLASSPLRL